jgi:hypothetical protein
VSFEELCLAAGLILVQDLLNIAVERKIDCGALLALEEAFAVKLISDAAARRMSAESSGESAKAHSVLSYSAADRSKVAQSSGRHGVAAAGPGGDALLGIAAPTDRLLDAGAAAAGGGADEDEVLAGVYRDLIEINEQASALQ